MWKEELVAGAIAHIFNHCDVFDRVMLTSCAEECSIPQANNGKVLFHLKDKVNGIFGAIGNNRLYRQLMMFADDRNLDLGSQAQLLSSLNPFRADPPLIYVSRC